MIVFTINLAFQTFQSQLVARSWSCVVLCIGASIDSVGRQGAP